MLVALISIPVVFLIVWVATRRWIARPLDEAVVLASRVAGGDFTTHIESRTHDEIGQLMRALADMVGKLGRTIAEVRHAATAVAGDATQLRESSDSVAQGSNQQSDAASGMAAAVEQMTASIGMIVEHAEQAHAISQESQEVSRESSATIQSAVAAMTHIAETVRQASEAIEQLGRESEEISNIVRVIKDIADQTNLLALNAAIEAARAGEQGRGFAVVADEVRKLAERTGTATSEIGAMIDAIQQETSTVVATMQAGGDKVVHGVKLADDAAAALDKIKAQAMETVESVNAIAAATREQQAASSDIARNVERIAQMTEDNGRSAGETAESARHLDELATALQGRVARFTL
jgi:methyl-accepting chemotaxis protein-2 (aspartate sensor receptor)